MGCFIHSVITLELMDYCHSDFARDIEGDIDNRKNIIGFVFFLRENAIS